VYGVCVRVVVVYVIDGYDNDRCVDIVNVDYRVGVAGVDGVVICVVSIHRQ